MVLVSLVIHNCSPEKLPLKVGLVPSTMSHDCKDPDVTSLHAQWITYSSEVMAYSSFYMIPSVETDIEGELKKGDDSNTTKYFPISSDIECPKSGNHHVKRKDNNGFLPIEETATCPFYFAINLDTNR